MDANQPRKPTIRLFLPGQKGESLTPEHERRVREIAGKIADLAVGAKLHEREAWAQVYLKEAMAANTADGFLIGVGAAFNLLHDHAAETNIPLSTKDSVAVNLYGYSLLAFIQKADDTIQKSEIARLKGELTASQQRQREVTQGLTDADGKIAKTNAARNEAYRARDAATARAVTAESSLTGANARADSLARRVEDLERQLAAVQRELRRSDSKKLTPHAAPPAPPESLKPASPPTSALSRLSLPQSPAIIIPGKWSEFEKAFDGQPAISDRLVLGPAARREIHRLNGNNSAVIEPCMKALNALARYYVPWRQTGDRRFAESYRQDLAELHLVDRSCARSAHRAHGGYQTQIGGTNYLATQHILDPKPWDDQRSLRIYYSPQLTPAGKVVIHHLPTHGKTLTPRA